MPYEIGLPDPRRGQGSLIMQAPEGIFPDVDEYRRRKKLMKRGADGRLRDRFAEPWEPDWNSEM
jgi:hypothetical protein